MGKSADPEIQRLSSLRGLWSLIVRLPSLLSRISKPLVILVGVFIAGFSVWAMTQRDFEWKYLGVFLIILGGIAGILVGMKLLSTEKPLDIESAGKSYTTVALVIGAGFCPDAA
jgi:uncharacterized membrane protein